MCYSAAMQAGSDSVPRTLIERARARGRRVREATEPRQPSVLLRVPPTAVLVGLVVVALAIWRLAFVFAGPDPDSDAYGHHAIARQILVNPKDLTVHWVWLPLFHYLQAGAILLGATLDTVRVFNVLVSSAVPILLYLTLREGRAARTDRLGDPSPTIAALICAISPIAMQMGTTGQTEPLFALLTMVVAFALTQGRMRLLAFALFCAVLLRYEAWSVLAATCALFVVERVFRRKVTAKIPWWAVAIPIAAILGWAAIRRPVDGSWFWFLKGTREFANDALKTKSSFELGRAQLIKDLARYAIEVPWRVIGYPLLLAPLGIVRTWKRDGMRFCAVFLAVLGFVTFAWIMRSSLGLDRHFVALVPFYATLIGNGVVVLADAIGKIVERLARGAEHAFLAVGSARAAVIAGLCCAMFVDGAVNLARWMDNWRHASEEGWPDRRLIAGYLRALPGAPTIFCDEATVELLSGLDRHRFERVGVADPTRVAARAAEQGVVYVVSWAPNLKGVAPLGVVVFRPSGSTDAVGLEVLRVPR